KENRLLSEWRIRKPFGQRIELDARVEVVAAPVENFTPFNSALQFEAGAWVCVYEVLGKFDDLCLAFTIAIISDKDCQILGPLLGSGIVARDASQCRPGFIRVELKIGQFGKRQPGALRV